MQEVTAALSNLIVSALLLLAGPTVLMLLVRRFVPYLGEQLWRIYCDVLMWSIRAPFRLVRFLINEVTARNRR
ncbi:hypothetical protein ACPCHT_09210 [Nucisporomicrobium flavum]|jgi:hypothetical protein|uniref:hypothetical protein n=1 Tax=Nucisporomicrobium flavum TaxID=2785915 RepID=UPI0018F614B6|nr:hypothetical protein [Nucisporomicrobium flavum]